ncbi:MAG: hypothetical protein U0570_11165 [Phycisphaerales bacterium]
MKNNWCTRVLGGLALCASAVSAQGAVLFFDIFYNVFYYQTTSSPPSEYSATNFAARLIAQDGDVGEAAFSPLGADPFPLPEIAPSYFLYQDNFATEAEALDRYPAGTYGFFISGGSLGDQSGFITRFGGPFWCEEVPAFTEGTFDAMQSVDASQDFVVAFNTFVAPGPANIGITFFAIFDESGAVVYLTSFGPDVGSANIPVGTLLPGKTYSAVIYFSSRVEEPSDDFGGTTEIIGFDRVTSAPLITRPNCVGDLNADGFVDDSDFVLFVVGYDILDCADPAMPADCPADLNRDGFVDDSDFVLFVAAYNELLCP